MSLVAHYKLDGNANDALGKYNGTASNVTWVDGKLGKAGSFNGSTSYVTTPLSTATHNLLSVSFWIFNQNSGSIGLVGTISGGRTFNLYRYPNKDDFHWATGTSGGSGVDYDVLPFDQWTHVAFVNDGSTFKRYYNGVLKGTSEGSIAKNTSLLHIGRNDSGYSTAYIDDFRIYDHALSEREVRDLSQGLVLHYTFDQFQEPTENLYASASKSFTESLVFPISPPVPPENGGTWSGLIWNGDITLPDVSAGESITWSGYYMPYSSNTSLTPVSSDIMGIHLWSSRGHEGPVLSCPEWNKWYKFTFTKTFDSSATSVRIEDRGYDYSNTNAAPYTSGYWCNIQIEKKKYTTPFVNGTRTGIVRDQSTQGNDAPLVLANTPKWVEGGIVGKGCYEFNGLNTVIATDLEHSSLGQEFTISAWVFARSGANHKGVIGDHGGSTQGIVFAQFDNGTCFLGYGSPSGWLHIGALSVPLNQWVHLTMTLKTGNGGFGRAFMNGYQVGATVSNPPTFKPLGKIVIGRAYNKLLNRYWDGQIDDVRIYTTALSADDVKELYQQRASLDSHGNFYSSLISSSVGYQKVWGDGTGVGFTTYGIDVSSVSTNGVLRFTTSVNDPMINMYNIGSFDPNVYKFIQVKYRVVSGKAGNVEIFFTNTQYTSANGANLKNAPLNSDGNWNVVTVAMHTHPNWTNSNITGWRFDMGTASGVTIEVEWIRLVSDTGALSVKSNKVVGDFSEVGITNGLVAYYPLNKDAKDYSGSGYHGTVTGAVLTGGGFDGNGAYRFDGYPHSITGLGQYTSLTKFTYSAWVNRSVNQENFLILGARQGNNTYISMAVIGNRACLHKYGFNSNSDINVALGSTLINTGVWKHIVITYDEGETKTYVDGVLDGSGFHTNTSYSAIGMQINYEAGVSDTHKNFKGDISNVKIFNRALSPEEIAVEYKRTGVSKMTQHNGTTYIQGQVKETI